MVFSAFVKVRNFGLGPHADQSDEMYAYCPPCVPTAHGWQRNMQFKPPARCLIYELPLAFRQYCPADIMIHIDFT